MGDEPESLLGLVNQGVKLLLASFYLAKGYLEVVFYVLVLDIKKLFEAFPEVAGD